MIFDLTKSYVPEAYSESRDYRVFLKLLGMLLTVFKQNIDSFIDLQNASECPDHLLPLLAEMVGYRYKDELPINSNRKIIKYFPYLLRNRGSELGIKLATVLSINTDPGNRQTYSMDSIIVESNPDLGIITIAYPRTEVINWDLIESVRPVGTRIKLMEADTPSSNEVLKLKFSVDSELRSERFDESKVDESQVNYSINRDISNLNETEEVEEVR